MNDPVNIVYGTFVLTIGWLSFNMSGTRGLTNGRDEVVVLPDDGSLPTAAPDEAAARARHVGRRLRLEGDDDQADWAAVSRCYVSYVEGFEGVVLGVERDGVVVDHLLADLDLGATWEDGGV